MMSFDKAINLVIEGKRVTRASWLCHHIKMVDQPDCKHYRKIVIGSVINGYNLYTASEEDMNANDWIIYDR